MSAEIARRVVEMFHHPTTSTGEEENLSKRETAGSSQTHLQQAARPLKNPGGDEIS
jgi:hypothetical protein